MLVNRTNNNNVYNYLMHGYYLNIFFGLKEFKLSIIILNDVATQNQIKKIH